MTELEHLIRDALLQFADHVARTKWHGREREAVSLFAFGFLVPRCGDGRSLTSAAQIGLDVGVPQLPGTGRKAIVCKDLVVWPEADGNCWDASREPSRTPLAILEWKARTHNVSRRDENWLHEFSKRDSSFLGVAVSVDPRGSATRLAASRARAGVLTPDWVRFPE